VGVSRESSVDFLFVWDDVHRPVAWRGETVRDAAAEGCASLEFLDAEGARGEPDAAEEMKAGPIIGGMTEQGTAQPEVGKARDKRRYWAWLLVVPLVLLVYPGMYARMTPELFGFPFFYWYQFAVVIATALLTGAVYVLTRNRADE
jgi:hypothetical protein